MGQPVRPGRSSSRSLPSSVLPASQPGCASAGVRDLDALPVDGPVLGWGCGSGHPALLPQRGQRSPRRPGPAPAARTTSTRSATTRSQPQVPPGAASPHHVQDPVHHGSSGCFSSRAAVLGAGSSGSTSGHLLSVKAEGCSRCPDARRSGSTSQTRSNALSGHIIRPSCRPGGLGVRVCSAGPGRWPMSH